MGAGLVRYTWNREGKEKVHLDVAFDELLDPNSDVKTIIELFNTLYGTASDIRKFDRVETGRAA